MQEKFFHALSRVLGVVTIAGSICFALGVLYGAYLGYQSMGSENALVQLVVGAIVLIVALWLACLVALSGLLFGLNIFGIPDEGKTTLDTAFKRRSENAHRKNSSDDGFPDNKLVV